MTIYRTVRIRDIGDVITGKTPTTNDITNYGEDFMFVGPSDLHKHFIVNKSEKMISKKGLNSIKGSILNQLSIMVGCIGWDMGNVALVQKKCATNQQINSITNIKDDYNPYYIYYWLKNKKNFLFQQANVTRTPILNKSDFSNIEISVPNKIYQDRVATCLTSLDKKIELNNRINAELEAMAKTLYDYWFVQFDFPDKDGKPYKSSGGKMVWNEELKREIPEGWKDGTLEDISELVRGVTYNSEDIKEKDCKETIPVLRATNVTGNVIDLENMVYIPIKKVSSNQILNKYDILLVMSSGSKEHIGKNGFYYFEDKVAFGAFCAKLVAKGEFRYYLYSYTQSDFMFNTIKNECLGTNINNLNNSLVKSFRIIVPPDQVIRKYNSIVSSIFEKIANNNKESIQLSSLRDWLLPMLMNGQVTVGGKERKIYEMKEEEVRMAAEAEG